MSEIVYEASVYTRTMTYKNFKQQEQTVELHFALDPMQLMELIASVPTSKTKSNNPAIKNGEPEISEEHQLRFMRDLAAKAAGWPSDDGESWEPFEEFEKSIAGKAFITKLASSDSDRKEFAEKVILDPFRAFVKYAAADADNTPKEIQQFQTMLAQMERVFTVTVKDESVEDRRARLAAEMAELDNAAQGAAERTGI